jgi:hypothetical protein
LSADLVADVFEESVADGVEVVVVRGPFSRVRVLREGDSQVSQRLVSTTPDSEPAAPFRKAFRLNRFVRNVTY